MLSILLFHGLNSGPEEFYYITRKLRKLGYNVITPTINGYSRKYVGNTYENWITNALEEFDKIEGDVVIGGICIGSLLALQVAKQRKVAGILALSTTLKYDGWDIPWTHQLLPLHPYIPYSSKIPLKEKYPFGVKNPRVRKLIEDQLGKSEYSIAGIGILSVGGVYQARALGKNTWKLLKYITAPILIIHAMDDEIASVTNVERIQDNIGSKHVETVILTNSYHMITIDNDRDTVVENISKFIKGIL